MALEDILKRIREDARQESRRIRKEAEEETKIILEEAEKEAGSIKEKSLGDARICAQSEKRRILTMANLEAKKRVLGKKQDLIEEAFQKAWNHLGHLSDEEYLEAVKKMLLRAVESGKEEVIISPGEKRITSAFLDKVNEELRSTGRPGELKLSPERKKFQGGFILREGRKEANNTFNSLFKERREELETEVAGILFGS